MGLGPKLSDTLHFILSLAFYSASEFGGLLARFRNVVFTGASSWEFT